MSSYQRYNKNILLYFGDFNIKQIDSSNIDFKKKNYHSTNGFQRKKGRVKKKVRLDIVAPILHHGDKDTETISSWKKK